MRIALMVISAFFKAIYYFIKIWWCGIRDSISFEEGYSVCRKGVFMANKAGRVTIEAIGVENIPKENGFIMFPNHQGLYDMLAFMESCPKPFSFIMKKEASKIILLKQVLQATDSLVIDREDIRQSMQVITEMSEKVKEGRNYLIFPEGTRSKQGNIPGIFKAGSFKSATKAKCPIVPCAIIDAFIPFDQQHIKPVTVKVIYLTPLLYEDYKGMKTHEIAEIVRNMIIEAIKRYK